MTSGLRQGDRQRADLKKSRKPIDGRMEHLPCTQLLGRVEEWNNTYDCPNQANQVVLERLALKAGEICLADIAAALLQELEVRKGCVRVSKRGLQSR